MGEKEPDPGQAARGASQAGMVSGREAGSGMATGRVAGGGAGGGPAEASNLNLSKAGIDRDLGNAMGAGRTADDDWGGHTPAASEKWTVDSTPPDVSAVGGGDAGAAGIAIGDPGVNGNISDGPPDPAETAINTSHSNIKNLREMASDGSPDPAESAINNSHSNIKNLREMGGGGTTDPTPAESAVFGGMQDPTPAESAVVKSKSNIANNRSETE